MPPADGPGPAPVGPAAGSLRTPAMAAYGLGDFTINTALTSLGLVYASFYLTQIAGLSGTLAGLVPLIARAVDAFTDPLMGRISDRTRWRAGRRRPYFLIGAVPFGLAFALLWVDVPFASQAAKFAYYAAAYCLLSVASTVLAVPYLALLPEMATGYDSRTTLNTWRNVGSLLGVFAAIGIRPVAELFGGGSSGFALAGACYGVLVALPWLVVHRVSFERPEYQRAQSPLGFRETLRVVFANRTFAQLTAMYLFGRIAMDMISALLILYFTFWIGRGSDFELFMFVFLLCVMFSLPGWLRVAPRFDKVTIFIFGSLWWAAFQLLTAVFDGESSRFVLFAYGALAAIGYAVVDLMPWAMVGEAVDEDELESGERREGIYNGVFTFLRKLAGAIAVFGVLSLLDVLGFVKGEEQTETVRQAIRWLTASLPVVCLLISVQLARGYPLTREAHAQIVAQLEARRGPA